MYVIFAIIVESLVVKLVPDGLQELLTLLILGLLIHANLTLNSHRPPQPKPWASYSQVQRLLRFSLGMFLPLNFAILVTQRRRTSTYLAGHLLTVVTTFERTLTGLVTGRLGRCNVITVTPFLSTTLSLARWLPASCNGPRILFTAFYRFSSKKLVSLAFCRDSANQGRWSNWPGN